MVRQVVALLVALAPMAFGFLALTDPPAAGALSWNMPAADRSSSPRGRATAEDRR
jgi:hypothetical protein